MQFCRRVLGLRGHESLAARLELGLKKMSFSGLKAQLLRVSAIGSEAEGALNLL